jgi:nitroimidazol reductase NimA-like FMN-containing flavoprotein (pyridoxamine 5'-phosphate oxidase superfamily)
MRRADREIIDPDEILEIIRASQVCRVGMCCEDGPYIVPMSFGLGDGCLYLHSAGEGRKLEALKHDPRVCVEFEANVELLPSENPCGIGFRYRSALVYGKAEFVTDRAEKQRGLDILVSQYGQGMAPVPDSALDGVTVVRVDIARMNGKKAHC